MHCIKPSLLSIILILLCAAASFGQHTNPRYDSLWKKTDTLIFKKGLTKSALAQVATIYTLAKKENQQAQLIKALVYRLSLQEMVEEDAVPKSIRGLEDEIRTSAEPARSILYSILAYKYYYYYLGDKQRFNNRSNTKNFKKDDVSTWSENDFIARIGSLYLESIKNKTLLQKTLLEPYNAIIMQGDARALRPTLYDLLAYPALNYFSTQGKSPGGPAYAFEMKDERLFDPYPEFIQLKIKTADTASLLFKALAIYQDILEFHSNDDKPAALADADLNRLQFVFAYSVSPHKDSLYEKALLELASRYTSLPTAAQAIYLVANRHVNSGSHSIYYSDIYYSDNENENDADTTNLAYAAQLCKMVLAQPGESEGKNNCYNLLKTIEQQSLHLTSEKINVPGQPFRSLVSYRNLSQLYFRVMPFDARMKALMSHRNGIWWKSMQLMPSLRSWTQPLPASSDYRKHSTEVRIDALPTGEYLLVASANADLSTYPNLIATQHLYVSNISYINSGSDYFVLNRETGQPLAKAVIQQWWRGYDAKTQDYKRVKGERVTTDEHGFARLSGRKTSYHQMQLTLYYNGDSLFIDEYQYNPLAEEANTPLIDSLEDIKKHTDVYFFTDRAIYRPGQVVYFKGIVITRDKPANKIRPWSDKKSKVLLSDVNGNDVDSLEVTTNSFGSYSGHFKLPANLLNGEFTISDKDLNSNTSFSVEEYKRPKFYAQFDTVHGSYHINDSITITGFAKGYAGNMIDGAKVSYRVQRVTRFIYPWLFWSRPRPRITSLEIANGELTTAADGSFRLRFKAIPDLSAGKELDPVFDYEVTADITDANGETRSSEKTVQVSYRAIQLSIVLPAGESMPADSFRSVALNTVNTSGEFIPVPATISISRLRVPDRPIRERYWGQPDQFIMSKDEYLASFPFDEYKNESDRHSWPKEKTVWQATDTTGPQKQFSGMNKLPGGWYVIEATARDINGDSVKDIKYVQLSDNDRLAAPDFAWSSDVNPTVDPGQHTSIQIGSSAGNLFVIQEIHRQLDDDKPHSDYSFITLNNEKKTIDFVPTESDRGGFGVYHLFVRNNRFYSLGHKILVPWTNKELTIQYETFRDKTLPGSEEKWRMKVSGPKKEKVAAEMLAGMYDASLDQFQPHVWSLPDIYSLYQGNLDWSGAYNFQSEASADENWKPVELKNVESQKYDVLITGLKMIRNPDRSFRAMIYTGIDPLDMVGQAYTLAVADWEKDPDGSKGYGIDSMMVRPGLRMAAPELKRGEELSLGRISYAKAEVSNMLSFDDGKPDAPGHNINPPPPPQIRKNFNETAFFFPDLQTDSAGDISFGFTMPEALTQWKFQALAHTRDLAFGYTTKNIVTQKPLMVQPNAPRFLREGDRMDFSAKVVNLSDKEQTGTVQLELLNAATNEPADGWFRNMYPVQYFTAEAGQSTVVKFSINVPYQYGSAVVYRFVAKAGDNSDGEEAAMPVLTNTTLVTESMPLPIRGNKARNFKFDKLLQSGSSETLQQHALTVEFTSNPAWYAVQALPYLADYPYECAEQTFNRYYANALSSMIAGAAPKLKTIVDKWNSSDTAALLSNLQKNEELKSALLEETPWVLEARSEAQQKKNIALLFDMVRMNAALSSSFAKLKELQNDDGGFVWFKGGHDDRYITQYILSGIGHLKKLHALSDGQKGDWKDVIKAAIAYADRLIKEDYDNLIKHKVKLDQNNLGNSQVQYLYLRSMFNEYSTPGASFTAINYYRNQSRKYWLQQSKYMQGMIALSLFRTGDIQTAKDIVKSLKENAIVSEELGMYWKDNIPGYYWQQAPIETQSMLIEAFSEISRDNKTIDDLKTWLLKQKQVQDWGTTRATAEACYALLLQGGNWLNNTPEVTVKLGDKTIGSTEQAEAGTGYFRKTFEGPFVTPSMGDISVRVATSPGATPSQSSWGAVYWQYFEQLDKITSAATPLRLDKKLFIERNTDKGPVLEPVAENGYLKVGDKIKVRIELRADRDMEYVHMKDMRASCMEPVNVLSSFKWQDGLGYYESTKDASTSFFFSWLPKGTYVFEYTLFVTHAGNFSNGITTIQCMYAPEFASHSEGIRVNVE